MRRLVVPATLALLLAMTLQTLPVAASPRLALPTTVRVNVAGLGVTRAVIAALYGTLTALGPDGRVLYKGTGPTLTRRDVRRLISTGGEVPRRSDGSDPNDITSLRQAMLDAKLGARDTGIAPQLRTIPFEFVALENGEDGSGPALFSAESLQAIRFTTDIGPLTYNGSPYRGILQIERDDEGDMIVVSEVSTVDYLNSVVGSEVPNEWEVEALAAQAIAARTYLLTHLGRHGTYDLEGDTRDQAYDGMKKEARSTIEAVRETSGLVATYRGNPISALYTANAGGRTENSEDVYVSALPYLRSVLSPTDDAARTSDWGHTSWAWNREFTARMLADHLRARGIFVGTPQKVDILQVTGAGNVQQARVTGTTGVQTIGKDASRYYFGLKSNLYTVTLVPGGTIEEVDPLDTERLKDMDVLGAEYVATAYRVTRNADREVVSFELAGVRYRLPDRFVFEGKGYGHRVGMSQWGAQGMALKGATFSEILKHYYTGIELTNVGGG